MEEWNGNEEIQSRGERSKIINGLSARDQRSIVSLQTDLDRPVTHIIAEDVKPDVSYESDYFHLFLSFLFRFEY